GGEGGGSLSQGALSRPWANECNAFGVNVDGGGSLSQGALSRPWANECNAFGVNVDGATWPGPISGWPDRASRAPSGMLWLWRRVRGGMGMGDCFRPACF